MPDVLGAKYLRINLKEREKQLIDSFRPLNVFRSSHIDKRTAQAGSLCTVIFEGTRCKKTIIEVRKKKKSGDTGFLWRHGFIDLLKLDTATVKIKL